jgi:hypothetical protein
MEWSLPLCAGVLNAPTRHDVWVAPHKDLMKRRGEQITVLEGKSSVHNNGGSRCILTRPVEISTTAAVRTGKLISRKCNNHPSDLPLDCFWLMLGG